MIGYEYLFEKVGPIEVSGEMIGVNVEGKVKAWLNKDWSKNYP